MKKTRKDAEKRRARNHFFSLLNFSFAKQRTHFDTSLSPVLNFGKAAKKLKINKDFSFSRGGERERNFNEMRVVDSGVSFFFFGGGVGGG